ncbi:MAG TPA: hypothetical protein VNV66_10110 [Pilimelia sp.]|nr:hypothetical protein [Pilimelia sp.]
MLRRVAPALAALAVAAACAVALAVRPPAGGPQEPVDYVVVVGVAGLRWEDVDPQSTPTLWAAAERGSIGALSVRSARQPTCPVDGWLTLGAGNYAAWRQGGASDRCPPFAVSIRRPDATGAHLPDQRAVVSLNKEKLPWGAVPGALPESVRCTVAVGPGAAVAAARPFGRVDRYEPTLPTDPARLLASCVLSIVDAGTVSGDDPGTRRAQARAADRRLARVLAARPPSSLVLVAGVSDTDAASRLHVAVADGPGWQRGWLTSPSTGRVGYLQLIDLAPTALAALAKPAPQRLFAGQAAHRVSGRPDDLRAAIAAPADADREARAQRRIAGSFFAVLTAAQVLLFLAVVPLLRRARRHAGPGGAAPAPRRLLAVAETLLVAAALAIPTALVADLVPWWRSGRAGLLFTAAALAVLAAATALVRAAPGYRRTLGPVAAVAAFAAAVVAADVVTGAQLQLNGVAGYSALEGRRYAGLGTVGLGVLIAGVLLGAGYLAQRVRRAWRPAVVVGIGGVGVMLVGSPYLGADAVGAVALTAGVCIAAAMSTGGWLTLARLTWATLAGLAVTVGFAVLDLRRAPEQRGSLGRFLSTLGEGTGGPAVHRTGAANVTTLATSPLTLLALLAAVFVWLALLRHWGGLKRLYGIYPAMRAAAAGIAVATLIAGVVALRVLDHAADRTRPPVAPPSPPRPAAAPAAGPAPVSPPGPAAAPAAGRDTAPTGESAAESPAAAGGASSPTPGEVLPSSPVDRVI